MPTAAASAKGFLIRLAAEGIAPVIGGCAGAVVGGPAGAVAGGVLGKVAEEAVKYFGPGIVESWLNWLKRQPPGLQAAAVEQVGSLTPSEARQAAEQAIEEVAPDALPEDKAVALEYLAAIPAAVRRSLVTDRARGGLSVPATMGLANPRQLLGLLPSAIPPYRPGSDLPGTPYRLTDLVGSGGFGAVYRATAPTLQNLAFAIKFCLDPSLLDALKRERSNLDRLQSAQTSDRRGAEKIVRLYGYDFDHRTPYLVYEFVPGCDLSALLNARRDPAGKGLPPGEALALVTQVAEALAFAHAQGLVHRDLKPANVLACDGAVKLTDFGIGGVTAAHAAHTRIGSTTIDRLDAAEQATLFRGAGTALYMAPEQRRGEPPDPRHDLYSLGVMWYQLLVGDVSRELHPGWADELLEDHAAPPAHVAAIRACVGVLRKRPEDAGKLLALLRDGAAPAALPVPETAPPGKDPPAPNRPPVAEAEARAMREDLVRAVLAAESARRRDWRWGVWLAGVLGGSIGCGLGVLFLIMALSADWTRTRQGSEVAVVFAILACVFGPLGLAGTAIALASWRSRRSRQTLARAAVVSRIESIQAALSLPPLPIDPEDHAALRQAGWDLARELEQRHLRRDTAARVKLVGKWFFDRVIKVYLDGYLLGEGSTRRGFDLPAWLCRGTHQLELQVQRQEVEVWRNSFVLTRDGEYDILAGPLTGVSLKVEVVGAH